MLKPLVIAEHYFELSNKSNFEEIEKLFTDTTTYSSQATGIYLGTDNIIAMQKQFHDKFTALSWKVNSVEEIKPGIVLFDYDFSGTTQAGQVVSSSGLEYVIVYEEKIQHIEIRNKSS